MQLPAEFIDSASVSISAKNPLPRWQYRPLQRKIYFGEILKADTELTVRYLRQFPGLLSQYSLFDSDSLPDLSAHDLIHQSIQIMPNTREKENDSITLSGTQTVGISIGSDGGVAIDQSLNVELFGLIDSVTRLSAHISDQSTSLEGQTREVGELDRIYLTVENPRWTASVGDLEVRSNEEGILRELYTPKGVYGELRKEGVRKNLLFGGISGHQWGMDRFVGVSGIQGGRFHLTGNGDPGEAQILEGSVTVMYDSEMLTETTDYLVDYTTGSISFTPKVVILDGQIIEVRYRYRAHDYTRMSAGTIHEFTLQDSALFIGASFFAERDNPSSSARGFTPQEIKLIEQSGDTPPPLLTGWKVHENDVVQQSALNRLYTLDTLAQRYAWESDPEDAAYKKDLYMVNFSPITKGEYLPFSSEWRDSFPEYSSAFLDSVENNASAVLDPIYLYVGYGKGTHTAYGSVVLPQQQLKGEMHLRWNPSDQVFVDVVAAGINHDKNILSSQDDENNLSSAFRSDVSLSTPTDKSWLIQGDVLAARAGVLFTNDLIPLYDLDKDWGIDVDSTTESYDFWETILSFGPQEYLLLSGGYGEARVDNHRFSQSISGGIKTGSTVPFLGTYRYNQRLIPEKTTGEGRNQELTIEKTFDAAVLSARAEEEWYREDSSYSGFLLGEANISFPKIGFDNVIQYKRTDVGTESTHRTSTDSSQHVLITSSIDHALSSTHTVHGTGSFLYRWGQSGKTGTLLLSLIDRVSWLDQRAGSDIVWNLSSENRNEWRWQYIKVPDGTGTHKKDSITGTFIEAPFGDYIAQQINVSSDAANHTRFVRNAFEWQWYYRTPNRQQVSDGFRLGGALRVTEDVMPKSSGARAWIPGFTTIFRNPSDSLAYSSCSYNQDILWLPPDRPEIQQENRFYLRYTLDQSVVRREINGTSSFQFQGNKLHTNITWNGFLETRETESFQTILKDMSLKPEQSIPIIPALQIFLEETGGLTGRDSISGSYAAVRPGIRFLPKNIGRAEVSYSYAFVAFDGELLYPMAQDFAVGSNQRISLSLDLRAKERFGLSGTVRGDRNEHSDHTWRFFASIQASVDI